MLVPCYCLSEIIDDESDHACVSVCVCCLICHLAFPVSKNSHRSHGMHAMLCDADMHCWRYALLFSTAARARARAASHRLF
jgi:hypothetical protein